MIKQHQKTVERFSVKNSTLLLIALLNLSAVLPAHAQLSSDVMALCPVEGSIYMDAKRNTGYYQRVFDQKKTCPNARAMLDAWRNEIKAGRNVDACLCRLGACNNPDSELTNAYNRTANYVNKTCGWR